MSSIQKWAASSAFSHLKGKSLGTGRVSDWATMTSLLSLAGFLCFGGGLVSPAKVGDKRAEGPRDGFAGLAAIHTELVLKRLPRARAEQEQDNPESPALLLGRQVVGHVVEYFAPVGEAALAPNLAAGPAVWRQPLGANQ